MLGFAVYMSSNDVKIDVPASPVAGGTCCGRTMAMQSGSRRTSGCSC